MTDVGLGFEMLTQSATVTGGSTIDITIPTGKVVISSGVQYVSGGFGGYGSGYTTADGPHPTDATKWRFYAQVNLQSGGGGYSSDILCWMMVMNAAV